MIRSISETRDWGRKFAERNTEVYIFVPGSKVGFLAKCLPIACIGIPGNPRSEDHTHKTVTYTLSCLAGVYVVIPGFKVRFKRELIYYEAMS